MPETASIGSLHAKVAVLEAEHRHHTERLDHLIKAVEENNRIIERSKGIAFGASIVVSLIWSAGLFIWGYIKA